MKTLKKKYHIKAALCFLMLSGHAISAQTETEQKISSSTDDRVTQINVALTRMLDRQEAVRNDLSKLQENVSTFDGRLTSQGSAQLETLNSEIETIKAQISTELASVQDAMATMTDLKVAFDQERLEDQQKVTQLSDALEGLQDDVAALLQKQSQTEWTERFQVLKDQDGFADLLSREEARRVAVDIPDAENCPELGDWLVANVPMRDVNRFYIMKNENYAVCKIVNGNWSVSPLSANETSHLVFE